MTLILEMVKAILLGIAEGITEWVPLDASAHLKILYTALGPSAGAPETLTYFTVLRLGALIGVLLTVIPGILPFLNETKRGKRTAAHMWVLLPCACAVLILTGFSFGDLIAEKLSHTVILAAGLIAGGICLLLIRDPQRDPEIRSAGQISVLQALLLGLMSLLSLIPGIGLPAVLVTGGLILGFTVHTAALFSLYAAAFPVLAECIRILAKASFDMSFTGALSLAFGCTAAFLMSAVTVRAYLEYTETNDLRLFGLYRILFGTAVLVMFIMKLIPASVGV